MAMKNLKIASAPQAQCREFASKLKVIPEQLTNSRKELYVL